MIPAMVIAPIIPMSLYFNMVLDSCFLITRCMSSYKETKIQKRKRNGIAKEPIDIRAKETRIARVLSFTNCVAFGKSFHLSESHVFFIYKRIRDKL